MLKNLITFALCCYSRIFFSSFNFAAEAREMWRRREKSVQANKLLSLLSSLWCSFDTRRFSFFPLFSRTFSTRGGFFGCDSKKSKRDAMENSINKRQRQRHKIKWHYLKLSFTFAAKRRGGLSTIHCVCCMRLRFFCDNQFSFLSRQKMEKWRRDFPMCVFGSSTLKPSKRYQEMRFKIGGEPRCSCLQFRWYSSLLRGLRPSTTLTMWMEASKW